MLARTLTSLLAVRGVTREAILVLQHGTNGTVAAVAHAFGLRVVQNTAAPQSSGRSWSAADKGAERIAQQYKFALSHMFNVATDVRGTQFRRCAAPAGYDDECVAGCFLFAQAPAVIIAEDDFLFSPDFYEYFHATAPILVCSCHFPTPDCF